MTHRLRAVATPPDAGTEALRALRAAVLAALPELAAMLKERSGSGELVDVLRAVPGPRRTIMRACRSGRVAGAVRVGRRWLAPRPSIDAWLRELGPRSVAAAKVEDADDELEPLRRRLLAGGRR